MGGNNNNYDKTVLAFHLKSLQADIEPTSKNIYNEDSVSDSGSTSNPRCDNEWKEQKYHLKKKH